jgi:hypothetical protein
MSELCNSLCERRLERTVLRPAILPVKTAQFTQFSVRYDVTVKSLSLSESIQRPLERFIALQTCGKVVPVHAMKACWEIESQFSIHAEPWHWRRWMVFNYGAARPGSIG